MNAAVKFIQNFRDREDQLRLKGYRDKASLIRQQNLEAWDDNQLQAESLRLKKEAQGGAPLGELLIDAYALVCEAAKRTLGLRPYDVQIMAAIALHERFLIQQHTGEGKTLSAVMPAFLHALTGEGVHVLTFNDYLANRDANWMGPVYSFLGLTVGAVQAGMSLSRKREAYAADITYVTAKEAGFDYLRDTIALDKADTVHRTFHYVIVDEADSLLLDEARVPLVIAGEPDSSGNEENHLAEIARQLQENEHYDFDEFKRNVYLSEAGSAKVESLLACGNLYEDHNSGLLMTLNCALHAELLLKKDVDYIVRNGKIELIDEYTGRVAENRHLPEGLQSALYAKEGLPSKAGGKVLGTITLQHFLSLYPEICGMTATAKASAFEFEDLYSLQVVEIPSNRTNIRIDHPHRIYTHKEAKFKALVQDIVSIHSTGRPILIGTSSVEESVILAKALAEAHVPCHVLNAKNDAEEAEIIAKAGEIGAVTVSTNMAGRGVDIRLGGGNPEQGEAVARLGGLYVIGTHMHQSVRIDNQLRGRAGRQGDPGSSVFYVSLEDELLLQFGAALTKRGLRQDEALEDSELRDKIDHIQRTIMGQNFHIRQELNSYSDVIEIQRRTLYEKRLAILNGVTSMSPSEQRVRLFYIDKFWADHLAYASYIREGIHLTGLVKHNPIDEFHDQIIEAYEQMPAEIDREAADMLSKLGGSNDPAVWEKFGLNNPPSTWTYIINDQYQQYLLNRGSWTPGTMIAYLLRRLAKPMFGWSKF
ncbi:preprotein translocase subunit SecA [Paenibacillus sp. CAU 1782]